MVINDSASAPPIGYNLQLFGLGQLPNGQNDLIVDVHKWTRQFGYEAGINHDLDGSEDPHSRRPSPMLSIPAILEWTEAFYEEPGCV